MYAPIRVVGMGTGTLNGQTDVTITDSKILSTDKILIIGRGALAFLSIGTVTVRTVSNGSFVVYSTNLLDLRSFDYFIVRQD